ncbi:MAG: D-alanyl-D-alanine carboxypeptidase family protein [Mycobacteriales bacterium]
MLSHPASWQLRLARLLTCAALLSTAGLLGVARPPSARADDVAVAQARVDALQSLVVKTTRELTDGTRRWEADQQALRKVQLALRNTRRHVAEAQANADAGQHKLDSLARQMYSRNGQSPVQLVFTQSPSEFLDALQGAQLAERAAGTSQAVIAEAATTRHRLRQQEAEAEALATRAQGLVDRSAKRMRQLQALAQRTSDTLVAAETALQSARARRAAAEARARAARERAARSRYLIAGGPACTGKSTAGQQNGNLDPGSLCPLWQAPGHRLRSDAAAAFNKMSRYHASTVGSPLCVTDSYRSYSEQADVYRRKPGLAAVPGTSEHGWGLAVDFCGGIQNSGSAAHNWMRANAGRFGWYHPDWAQPSGSRPEAWHWEYGG